MKFVMVVLFVLFGQTVFAKESVKMPFPPQIQDSLPWFAVRELSDNNTPFTRLHLQQLAEKNKRVALVYFATWCIPCRVGLKQIADHREDLAQAGTAVVLVNVGERDTEMLLKYLNKFSLDQMKAVVDPFGRLTEGFGLKKENENMSLPRTIVVNSQLMPMFMIGEEGDDFISVLKGNDEQSMQSLNFK